MKKQMVEFAGQPVGIVIPENGRLKFVAVKFHVHGLDGRLYETMEELRLAIRTHVETFYREGPDQALAG
ncbi:hypothetical protein K7H91_10615 [Martelella mediterranea]|uniref:hypothetical protein n=1 Tax=Martelella mediterranea TaxID=293089 RepID=UPI001E479FE5|nr:hypothetical protein [Martelella mediterranea]MCD1634224.1 hypothetical protein [Martelella mediterranea]